MENIIFSTRRTRCKLCDSSDGASELLKYYDYDLSGGDYFKCFSCGAFISPASKGEPKRTVQAPAKVQQIKAPALNQYERLILLRRLFIESMANRLNNNFAKFMIELLGEDLANRSLYYYGIGSDNDNNTVFWFRNYDGEITHAKIISYDKASCKRLKGDKSNIRFINYQSGEIKHLDCFDGYCTRSGDVPKYENFKASNGYESKQMYNSHLLNPNFKHLNLIQGGSYNCDVTAPIILVESEKTAFLSGLLYPKLLFIACGGANGLTAPKLRHLLNRTIFVAFDNDKSGIESMVKVQQLVPTAIQLNPAILGITEPKADLFDYLITDRRRLDTALKIYNHRESFNYNINLQCDVSVTAPASSKKAVA